MITLLLQVFPEMKEAIISGCGTENEMMTLKEKSAESVKRIMSDDNFLLHLPKNKVAVFPQFHLLIAEKDIIQHILNKYGKSSSSKELYQFIFK